MYDYKPGDTVTLEHEDGSKLVDREVCTDLRAEHAAAVVFDSLWNLETLPQGWRVTSHTPKTEPLPTEPGWYVGGYKKSPSGFIAIELLRSGEWVDNTDSYYLQNDWVAKLTNLTRMVPQGSEREQAIRDVLKYIDDFGWTPGQVRIFEYGHAARILEHFGYAP